MAVLSLQTIRPTVVANSSGVASCTSSASHCCNKPPVSPGTRPRPPCGTRCGPRTTPSETTLSARS
ncbi:class III lanthipeptide [Streptomyces sp. NPDC004779]